MSFLLPAASFSRRLSTKCSMVMMTRVDPMMPK